MTADAIAPWMIASGAGLTVALFTLAATGGLVGPRGAVKGRLAALQDRSPYVPKDSPELLRDRSSGLPIFDFLLRGQRSAEEMRHTLEQAGLEIRIGEYLALRMLAIAIGVVGAFVLMAATGAAPAVLFVAIGGVAGLLIPGTLIRRMARKRRAAIELELVEMCDQMSSMLHAGFGYMQALNNAADQLEEPLAGELKRMRDQIRLGAGVDEALEQLNERLGSRDFDMVATAITIQRKSGGSLASILGGVAQTIRERHLFRAEIRALTSRERYSAFVLAGFPLAIAGLLMLMLPETFGQLITTGPGRVMLMFALALDGTGYFAIRRATRLEV